ncbi:lipid-binding SYLF domain-containing protein [Nitratiruptor sp. YY09-18]|uniref:lipid-binding SYLF domain-containing protein n=1 Tax=Nitratiruptor sp. YY09-18 TaxID=2724901 RepID=UPI0019381680|nr:lipid-binding SYLF domain-containing protein [Nitratiruptor sp. YY09-18]BCD68326.1 hypothetical protein NitYY0918_C1237 [Nitratiruptor sp. YY09-18]
MRSLLLTIFFAVSLFASPNSILIKSASALDRFMALPEEQIPPKLLAKAQAIAIIPGLIRGGFIAGARYGKGVLLVRKGKAEWSDPIFIKLYGASIGWQIGLESIDVVLVFTDRRSIQKLLNGKITLAADVSLAVGLVGRNASAGTDFRAEVYSYSRSMGAYIGIALAGATIEVDYDYIVAFYNCDPQKIYLIIEGKCHKNNEFLRYLKHKLQEYSAWKG